IHLSTSNHSLSSSSIYTLSLHDALPIYEIDRLQAEIDEIPVVQEFKEIQLVVNDVLQLITGTIAREVTERIIKSTGGNVLYGETGSKVNSNSTSCGN